MLALAAVACSSPSPTPAEGKVAAPTVPPSPADEDAGCQPMTAVGVWARVDDGACGWELRDDADGLALHGLGSQAPPVVRVPTPPGCAERTCVFHGAVTSAGPLLLAVVPSDESEMPSDVQLGVAHGEQMSFVSLWEGAGPSVVTDLTPVGPAHALAPFICGESLALLVVERLDAAPGLRPPQRLLARQGRVEPSALDTVVGEVDRSGCTAVQLPVP